MAKIRSRKELICLNVKDITMDEVHELGNLNLNCCDKCGEIDSSEQLIWIGDEEEYSDNPGAVRLYKEGHSAVCNVCVEKKYEEIKNKIIPDIITLCKKLLGEVESFYETTQDIDDVPESIKELVVDSRILIEEAEKTFPDK